MEKYPLFGHIWVVLIVPLWNWNSVNEEKGWKLDRFNRTFMELKCDSIPATKPERFVLIVPLWNWNNGTMIGDDAR